MKTWTQQEAIELCKKIEAICPPFGCHVALTGGLLYKDGPRKDCDILFYRIRQRDKIDQEGLFQALEEIDIIEMSGFGWCFKFVYAPNMDEKHCKAIDAFFPEEQGGEYNKEEAREAALDGRADAAMNRDLRKDKAWQDLGNTLRDMGNEQPEF